MMDCLQTVTLIIKHTKSDDKSIDISNLIGLKFAGSLPEEIAKEKFERNYFLVYLRQLFFKLCNKYDKLCRIMYVSEITDTWISKSAHSFRLLHHYLNALCFQPIIVVLSISYLSAPKHHLRKDKVKQIKA